MSQVYIEWHPRESSRVSCVQDPVGQTGRTWTEKSTTKLLLSSNRRPYSKEDNLSYLMGQDWALNS